MKVFVVEFGNYEQRYIAGVFSSLELALKAYPEEKWEAVKYGWTSPNGDINEYEVDETL